jgi:hypothetical protein
MSCLVGASCRRGLVERRGLVVAPSRSGISLCDDAEMSSLNDLNDVRY